MQVRDTLGALADRCVALKIDGAALHVSRLLRRESRGLAVKRITMYSPNWVKSQNRMSSTSNQAWCPLSPDVKEAQPPKTFLILYKTIASLGVCSSAQLLYSRSGIILSCCCVTAAVHSSGSGTVWRRQGLKHELKEIG